MVEKYYVDKWYLTLLMLQGLHKFSLIILKLMLFLKIIIELKFINHIFNGDRWMLRSRLYLPIKDTLQ
jgi:hypothetical protein